MNNIILYDKNTKKDNFENYGLGKLQKVKSCTITEELNGRYDLEMQVYLYDENLKYLTKWNIIRADNQLFRITFTKIIEKENIIQVKAMHIFYDLQFGFVEDSRCKNQPMKVSLEKGIPEQYKNIFTCNSDITETNSLYHVEDNGVTCVFNTLERWGIGELKRDNFNFEVNYNAGQDTGVTFTYNKIEGIEIINDYENVATKIYPKGFDGITLQEKYIDIPNWNDEEYMQTPIVKLVYFENAKTEVDLRMCATEFAETVGISTSNITIKLHDINNITVFNELKDLYKANIGDIVTIKHSKLDIRVKVKIITITKELIENKIELELGQPLDDFLKNVDNNKINFDDTGLINQMTKFQQGMYYHTNNKDISTGNDETVSLGNIKISLSENNNLMAYTSLYIESFAEGIISFGIFIDNLQSQFKPKQKLLQGDNIISFNFPLLMLQSGQNHTLEIRITTSCATTTYKEQFQLVVYGQFLEGGMGANSPYIDVVEGPIKYVSRIVSDEIGEFEFEDNLPKANIGENIGAMTSYTINDDVIITLKEDGVTE